MDRRLESVALRSRELFRPIENAVFDALPVAAVVVDRKFTIHAVHGDVQLFLAEPPGWDGLNLLPMLPEGLRNAVSGAAQELRRGNRSAVTASGPVIAGGSERLAHVTVRPFSTSRVEEACLIVILQLLDESGDEELSGAPGDRAQYAEDEQMSATREELLRTVAQLEATIAELRSRHDETNSANQDLAMVNSQLNVKLAELTQDNADLHNFLDNNDVATVLLDSNLNLRLFTRAALDLLGLSESGAALSASYLSNRIKGADLIQMAGDAIRDRQPQEMEVGVVGSNGLFSMRVLPYRPHDEAPGGVVLVFHDVTHLHRAAFLQSSLADLGARIAGTSDLESVFDESVNVVRDGLDVEFVKVTELEPEYDRFRLRAGSGWRKGLIGQAILEAGNGSQGGFTLEHRAPVVMDDIDNEVRFRPSILLRNHGVRTGLTMAIYGMGGEVFGVIGAFSNRQREFNEDDVDFMSSVAGILSSAVARTQEEDLRRESEENLQLALDTSEMGVGVRDLRTNEVQADRRAREIYGWPLEGPIPFNRTVEMAHPDDREKLVSAIDAARRKTGPDATYRIEHRIIRDDGSERWILRTGRMHRVNRFGKLEPVKAVTAVQDITERKLAEQELADAREQARVNLERLQGVFERMTEGVIILSGRERVIQINPAALKIIGYESLDQVNLVFDRVVESRSGYHVLDSAGNFLPHEKWPLLMAINGQPFDNYEVTIVRPDGLHRRIYVFNGNPVPGIESEPGLFVITIHDITDLRVAMESLEQSEARYRELAQDLENRVAERTEEVRLQNAHLSLLTQQVLTAEENERKRIAQGLHDDVQQLLAAARYSIQGLLISHSEDRLLEGTHKLIGDALAATLRLVFDLSPTILYEEGLHAATVHLADQMKELHGLDVQVTSTDSLEPMPEPLRVFLYSAERELLFNVVKHASSREASISLKRDGDVIQLQVEDYGTGFPVNDTTEGVGMRSLKQRLSLFGGQIDVDSAPGYGTRVTLRIPAGT